MTKNILITGASSGLGAALAEYYAAKGHRLFLGGRDMERLSFVAQRCRDMGAETHTQVVHVEAAALMHQWVAGIDKRFPLDLVIANAGVSGGTSGLSPEAFSAQSHHIFDVNVMGVLNSIGPVLPRMVSRKGGQIAIVSSLSAFAGWPGAPAYSASKAAVRFYGEALRGRFQKQGIKISVICPGFIRTSMTDINPFPMPYLMEAREAAAKIATGLERNKPVISFPWQVALVSKLIGVLPTRLRILLLSHAPEKSSLQNF
ncbi:MAG: short-chain dehydrogenase [Micavibrio aeruginosavorus]|uniref:Short-chain dehydrogenase n=1 Tax=Micavibrio aeruginosavorus TaxID=349221 RepID=A0A2W5FQ76_9BACT|nr:MAG: short-chain dehydrogenase [Micavibrio aeruginosavorus]